MVGGDSKFVLTCTHVFPHIHTHTHTHTQLISRNGKEIEITHTLAKWGSVSRKIKKNKKKKNIYICGISINVVFKIFFFTSLVFRASKHAYVLMCACKGSFMHARISRHKCIFYALTYLSGMLYITKYIIRRENKSVSTQEKAESTKKGAINPTVQN